MVDRNLDDKKYIDDALAENARELEELGLEGHLPTKLILEKRRDFLKAVNASGGIGPAVRQAEVEAALDITRENVSRVNELKELQKEMSENN